MRTWTEPSMESISALMLQLHEAPLVPTQWPVVLERFTKLLDLPAMTIQDYDYGRQSRQFAVSVGIDTSTLSQYERHFGRIDPYWQSYLRNPIDRLIHAEEICPRSELLETEFYGDFLARQDEPIGMFTAEVSGLKKRHMRAISTYQRLSDPVPSARVLDLIQLFRPHFNYCLGLQERMDQVAREKHTLETALNCLSCAVVVLDETGSAIFVSEKARILFNTNADIHVRNGRLDAMQSTASQRLCDSIARALSAVKRAHPALIEPFQIHRADGKAVTVRVNPIPHTASHVLPINCRSRAAVMVQFCETPDSTPTLETTLHAVYRLTPAESRIAMQLCGGNSLRECATRNATSVHTARTQLKAVFQKLGVRRQVELVRMLNTLSSSNHTGLFKP